jgi:AcrR family transcriptional regulator
MQQALKSNSAALLEAGVRLARRAPLSRMTGAVIATEAGLPSLRFFDDYPDLTHYLIDLYQQRFLRPVREQLEAMLARMPPGIERTRAIAEAYFDFCLRHRGLRRWTIEARALPGFNTAYNRASEGFQALVRGEIGVLGFIDSNAAARLCIAMVYEVTSVEMQDGEEHAGMRRCLWRLLEPTERPVQKFPPKASLPAPVQSTTATPRSRLLQAGEHLLMQKDSAPGELELDQLLAHAEVDRAGFEEHFGDVKTLQIALLQSWTERYMESCIAASQGMPPGVERIHAFMQAAWDSNLNEHRNYRVLMKALLATDGEIRNRILTRIRGFTRMVALEYQALGLSSPLAMARLFIAASNELVETEEAAHAAQPQLRQAFWQMFDPLTTRVRGSRRQGKSALVPVTAGQTSFLTTHIADTPSRGRRKRLSAQALAELRQRLVEAGDRLLRSGVAVSQLSPDRLGLLAGVEPGELTTCYPDFSAYLTELLTFLLDEARDITVEATSHQPPSLARMWRGIETFLDARLDRPAIHELSRLLQGYAAAAKLSRSRSMGFVRIFAAEFQSADWPDAQESAQLMVALVSETVQAEHDASRRLPEYRSTLHAFLTRG